MLSVLVHTGKGQTFVVEQLTSAEEVMEHSDFLNEGWRALSDPKGARVDIEWKDFMSMVFRCACGKGNEAVLVFKSKNFKPLGYMVLIEDSESPRARSAFIYAGYSNGKFEGAPEASMEYVQSWAKARGFIKLRAQSRRINGAAMRLFRKKLHFKPLAMIFEKEL